ncbi:MAG: AAA family ATPase [Bacteroidales bacterium]|nr:AAA family ATPase [Bacteroidales bacterium]
MKIKRLTIHNIASIADATIDFTTEPLASAPLFLITGQTGAGKSTIIDAICLALYGETPRMARNRSRESYVIERSDGDTDSIGINDNRQLMRRGTGECFAELLIEGNDERNYLARWQLRRAYNKPGGNLGKEEHTYTDTATQTVVAKNRNIDNELQLRLIGLTYSQFCRTSLLAQGEFTRFMHASSDEKSEILEKLTGTEIYSRLGKLIFNEARECETRYNTQRSAIDAIKVLTDEEVQTIEKQLDENRKLHKLTLESINTNEQKINWINQNNQIQKNLTQVNAQIAELEQWIVSDDYRAKLAVIADYEASTEARIRLADMLHAKKQSADLNTQLPKAQAEMEETKSRCTVAAEQLKGLQGDLGRKHTELEALKPDELNKRHNALEMRQRELNQLGTALAVMADNAAKQRELADTLQQSRNALADNDKELTAIGPEIERAQDEASRCRDRYNRMSLSTAQAAKELRAAIDIGDHCPVCGAKIEHLLTQEHFESQLQPLKEELDKADELMRNLKRRQAELTAKRSVNIQDIERWQKSIDTLRKQEQELKQNIETQAGAIGIAASTEVVAEALAATERELQQSSDQMKQMASIATSLSQLSEALKNAEANNNRLRETASKAEGEVTKIKSQIANLDTAIKQNRNYLDNFVVQNPKIDNARLQYLNSLKPTDVQKVKQYCDEKQGELQRLHGSRQQLTEQTVQLQQSRPAMTESDTAESLTAVSSELTLRQQQLLKEIATAENQLETNTLQQKQLVEMRQQSETLRTNWIEWSELAKHFGDSEGKKFRNIAQSFILNHILDIANHYLAGFSERYQLTCNPGSLVILVTDQQQGGNPQGINILSGGESFMVSLSLALALAHINSSKVNVDTLFIDEGFGTLSEDYLACVIDTLEKLRQQGGRRVGIISHVEELGERIATQIKVARVNPSTSEVHIVTR